MSLPGIISFNMSGTVKSKLPSDWDAEIKLKIKIPFFNRWVEIPCLGSCHMKNLCNKEMIGQCKKYLIETKSRHNPNKTCTCDYESGEYDVPTLQLPIKEDIMKNFKDLYDYLAVAAKGRDIKMDVILKSSLDERRFGCLQGIMNLI